MSQGNKKSLKLEEGFRSLTSSIVMDRIVNIFYTSPSPGVRR